MRSAASMKRLLPLFLLVLAAGAARADGVISVSWNGCTGPINLNTTGGTVLNAYVSVLGQSVASQSYQVWADGSQPSPGIRDAWRFDAAGCQGPSFFTLNHLAPPAVAKTCPSIQGALPSLQIKDYSYNTVTGKTRIVLANAYPNGGQGNTAATDPTQRYFLANWVFDMTYGVVGPSDPSAGTCGGIEAPMMWTLSTTSWLDQNGNEIPWVQGQNYITVNQPVVTAAPAPTWGQIKSQYRR